MNLERMKKRGLPWVPYRLLVVDGEQLSTAQTKLGEALERKRRADRNLVPEKPDRVKEVKNAATAVKRAENAFEACWETIRITALPPKEFERLKKQHLPTPEQLKDEPDVEYNRETFRPALLSACAEGDLSPGEWEVQLDSNFSEGEQQEIFTTALGVNAGTRMVESVVLPKGSIAMQGSLLNLR